MIDKQTLVEQQDSLLEFPCDFPIKVMGASIPHFAETIGAAVRELVPDFDPKTINERKSNGGKYTALTVTVHATSRAQLDSIYMMLTSHPLVKIVLHPPVYTAGRDASQRSGRIGDIPLIPVERGGDITYHAPGQIVVYPLLNLRRRHLFVKTYVSLLLDTIIDTLSVFGIESIRHQDAPGVYVPMPGGMGKFSGIAKIASIGIHVSRGCTLHGIALNVHTDLAGFRRISPCGYSGLRVTDMTSLGAVCDLETVKCEYRQRLLRALTGIYIESNND